MVARDLVGCIGPAKVMRLMCIVLTTLLTLLSLLKYSFVDAFKFVADVLKGIKDKGFTQSRWDAVLGYWEAVCRHGPWSSLFPPSLDTWIPTDLHGFL